MMPRISVVINTYNGAKVITDTINSILGQTYQNFEIVIIDDCSKDNTVETVRGIKDDRIRVYVNDENHGAAYSAQRGVDLAVGEYIAKTDQDDISYPLRFERQLQYMDKHREMFICGAYHDFYYDAGHRRENAENIPISRTKEFKFALLFNYVSFLHSTFFFRKKEAADKGIKYSKLTFSEDYSFITQAASKANIGIIKEVLVGYRIHDGQLSNYMAGWDEDKILIKKYAELLNLPKEWEDIAIMGAGGEIKTYGEFLQYVKLIYYFAEICGLKKDKENDYSVMKYVFRVGMRRQRQRNITELVAYLFSGLCDWKFIFSDRGRIYIQHCLKNGFQEKDFNT